MRRPTIGKNDTSLSWCMESPVITIIAMNTSGHHPPVSSPQGLCVAQEVPETTVGLLRAPGLLALPGIAALSPWGWCWVAGGAVSPLRCDGEDREQLLTDGQHEEREDAHHVPQAHVPEHHRLLGQRRRLGLGWGCAGLEVRREESEPGGGQGMGLG